MSTQDAPARMTYFFGEGQADGSNDVRHLVGGKGASLAEMTRAGLNVPPGFTISAECCQHYFRGGKKLPDGLEEDIRVNLARLEKVVGRPFGRGDNPLLVAVRSGAAESMPGMMDTLLNVGLNPECVRAISRRTGDPRTAWEVYRQFIVRFGQVVGGIDENVLAGAAADAGKPSERGPDAAQAEALCERLLAAYRRQTGQDLPADPWSLLRASVRAVFDSWQNAPAVAYRKHHNLQNLLGTAVTVQAMCRSEVSGVMFTANPVNSALNQIVIESSYGLGEAVVLGQVTPDRFVLDKDRLEILRREVASKDEAAATPAQAQDAASLTGPQLTALARLGLRVEAHFRTPCDIEWALAEDTFILLQARAIKGLEDADVIEKVRQESIAELRRLAAGRRCAWVIHNLAETLPYPTPMTWDIQRRFMSGSGGYGLMYQDFGYRPSARVKQEGFLDLVCGRICLNTDRHAEFYWSGFPWTYDIELVKEDPSVAEAMPTKMDPRRAGIGLFLKVPGLWRRMAHARKLIEQLQQDYDSHFREQVLPPYLDYVRDRRQQDLTRLDNHELLRELEGRCVRVLNEFAKEAIKLSYFGSAAHAELTARLGAIFGAEGPALAGQLAAGLDNDMTVETNIRLMEVARGKASREQFLEEFGHRANREFELAQPRWREDPSFIDKMIETFRADPAADPARLHAQMKARRQEVEASLPAKLKARGAARAARGLEEIGARVRRYMPYRESAKHYLLMGYELLRAVLLEIDRRQKLEGGVFLLRLAELPALMAGRDFSAEMAERRRRRRVEPRINVPDVVTSDDLEAIGRPLRPTDKGDTLQGTGVAPGSGTGPAAVLFDPAQAVDLAPGYILVCPSTDPGWTPLFVSASGLIMERGGVLSHGAIVARDLGIPAVVLQGATQTIAPGDWVRVDGDTGMACRVQPSHRAVAT